LFCSLFRPVGRIQESLKFSLKKNGEFFSRDNTPRASERRSISTAKREKRGARRKETERERE